MKRILGIWCAVSVALFCGSADGKAQSGSKPGESLDTYTLPMPVDEVVLTFSAEDKDGLPINDLKAAEIRVRDNGAAPRRIVDFDEMVDRPIRAAILLDTSVSTQGDAPRNKGIAATFVQRLLRQKSDEAFVSEFGYASEILQPWTGDTRLLMQGIQRARGRMNLLGGTALFNAVFRACSSSFGNADPNVRGNFILLFSDGEDNSGLTSMEEAARACQRGNTEIFAFIPSSAQDHSSTGPKALRELSSKTGGRVFLADDTEEEVWKDLKMIESEMRNQYRLVYNPENFKHDGTFHEIELQPPDRVRKIEIRSGYFAPRQ
jgi:Ca-activated chloride channel family protein